MSHVGQTYPDQPVHPYILMFILAIKDLRSNNDFATHVLANIDFYLTRLVCISFKPKPINFAYCLLSVVVFQDY